MKQKQDNILCEWGGANIRAKTSDGRNVNVAEELNKLEDVFGDEQKGMNRREIVDEISYDKKIYELKLAIAKIAYREIREVINKFEDNELDIIAHWDECISVGDELFHGHQLRNPDASQ